MDQLGEFEQFLRVKRGLSEPTRKAYLYDLTRFQELLSRRWTPPGHHRAPSLLAPRFGPQKAKAPAE